MSSGEIQDITAIRLVVTYLLFLVSFYVIFYYRLKLEKDAIISTLRMTAQLFVMGLILKYIFRLNEWYIVMLILLIMLLFGVHTILGRTGIKIKKTFPYLFFSMLIGCGLTMVFFIFVVVRQSPWYDARYLIPLFGMIVGNSMNSCALALERVYSGMKDTRDDVEALLSLGASPTEATRTCFLKAFKAAILPTFTAMAGMGVVHLPGMMTGQILSGSDPMVAVKYQIAIMLAILASCVFSSFMILKLETGLFFNKKAQLIDF